MADSITWVGLDVHKENIVAVAIGRDGSHQGRFEMTNSPKGKERLLARLTGFPKVRCAYEAGPTGYDLKRFLDGKGVECQVIAPSLIPRRPGDRIKTDTKDAEKIARMHRMGELVAIHVPTPRQESMRDLLRAREDACEDLVRKRHRLGKFFLRQGRRYEGKSWSRAHWCWIRTHFRRPERHGRPDRVHPCRGPGNGAGGPVRRAGRGNVEGARRGSLGFSPYGPSGSQDPDGGHAGSGTG
jgi:transposase